MKKITKVVFHFNDGTGESFLVNQFLSNDKTIELYCVDGNKVLVPFYSFKYMECVEDEKGELEKYFKGDSNEEN